MADWKELASHLECPVCNYIMSAPIRQCIEGHSVCDSCFRLLVACPQCRAEMIEGRCWTLEKICELVIFPCMFSENGCRFSAKIPEIDSHQKQCDYAERLCPMWHLGDNCRWLGTKSSIVEHFTARHPDNVLFERENILKIVNFTTQDRTQRVLMILQVSDTIFRFLGAVQEDCLKFSLYYYGSSIHKNEARFSYQVFLVYAKTGSPIVGTARSIPCYCLTDDMVKFQHRVLEMAVFAYDLCLSHCCDEGHLTYILKILEKKPDPKTTKRLMLKRAAPT